MPRRRRFDTIRRMHGLMMDFPLTLNDHLPPRRAAVPPARNRLAPRRTSRSSATPMRDFADRARRLAQASCATSASRPGDRVATLTLEPRAHLEAYFGIPLAGARAAYAEPAPAPRRARLHRQPRRRPRDSRRRVAAAAVERSAPRAGVERRHRRRRDAGRVPDGRSTTSAARRRRRRRADCRSSTRATPPRCATRPAPPGSPKGVLYSHRAIVAPHARPRARRTARAVASATRVLPVVPMFHANAWGLPFAAVDGRRASSSCPGRTSTRRACSTCSQRERVTVTAGVPTIWMGILQTSTRSPAARSAGDPRDVSSAAPPRRRR